MIKPASTSLKTAERSEAIPTEAAKLSVDAWRTLLPPDPPKALLDLVAILIEPEITLAEADRRMQWEAGTCRDFLRRYPAIGKSVHEGKILAMKAVGLEKVDAYKAIKTSLMQAVKRVPALDGDGGEDVPDYRERREAARDTLKLYGEFSDDVGTVNNTQVNITVNAVDLEDRIALLTNPSRK